MAKVCYRLVVSGDVQGVSFRASMKDIAIHHGVKGWVRNRDDGAVEALVQGEEAQVEMLLEWAKVGPPRAKVTRVERHRLDDCPPQAGFRVLVQSFD